MCRGLVVKHLTNAHEEKAICSCGIRKDEINTNDLPTLKFANVVTKFRSKFLDTYSSSDKKIHLTNLPKHLRIVDGAKSVWCIVLLIDAMISLIHMTEQPYSSTRRAFNQESNLFECVVSEMTSIQTNSGLSPPIVLLDHPWTSMSDLRESLAAGPHSKAKVKYAATVDMLLSHEVFVQFGGLQQVIQALFMRVQGLTPFDLPPVVTTSDVKPSLKRRRFARCGSFSMHIARTTGGLVSHNSEEEEQGVISFISVGGNPSSFILPPAAAVDIVSLARRDHLLIVAEEEEEEGSLLDTSNAPLDDFIVFDEQIFGGESSYFAHLNSVPSCSHAMHATAPVCGVSTECAGGGHFEISSYYCENGESSLLEGLDLDWLLDDEMLVF